MAVSAGSQHSLAITDSGDVWTWGGNRGGTLGQGDERGRIVPTPVSAQALGHSKAVASCCGEYHTMIVAEIGELWDGARPWDARAV